MLWEQRIQFGSLTDIGFRRQNNEDSLSVRLLKDKELWKTHGHMFIVADGMGGHAVGELASKIAIDTVPHQYFKSQPTGVPQEELKQAIVAANSAIYERSSANHEFQRMGTTCSALVLGPYGALVGHVGDSRVYRVRGDRIDQLTCDHSLEWELKQQAKGEIDPGLYSRSRHVITRSLGPEKVVEVDVEGPYPVLPGDAYIICSDGLTGHLEDDEIGMICSELDAGEACKLMVNLANLRGGVDNISVAVAEVSEDVPEIPENTPSRPAVDKLLVAGRLNGILTLVIFMAGLLLFLMQKWFLASVLMVLGSFSMASTYLLWSRWRNRQKIAALPVAEDPPSQSSTIVWRPYRSASAELNSNFLKQLDAIIEELIRTAQQDKWAVNWNKSDATLIEARTAARKKSSKEALQKYAEVIQRFMTALKKHRSGE